MHTRQSFKAVKLKHSAEKIRLLAPEYDPIRQDMAHQEAKDLERQAFTLLKSPETLAKGLGGEIIPPTTKGMPGLEEALKSPDLMNLEATIQRTLLADQAGVFDLALDAAESIKAKDAVQQMLSHQMAAAHRHAMRLLAESEKEREAEYACKKALTASKLIDAFTKAAQTLQRLQTGANQIVTVQHVQVNGQAFIQGGVSK